MPVFGGAKFEKGALRFGSATTSAEDVAAAIAALLWIAQPSR